MANLSISIPSGTPICDPKTGVVNQEWRLWFNKIYQRIGGSDAASNAELAKLVGDNSASIVNIQDRLTTAENNISTLQLSVADNTSSIASQGASITAANAAIAANTASIASNTTAINNSVQTINNVGTGTGVFSSKTGSIANFKSLKAGTGVTLDNTTNPLEIVINAAGGSSLQKEFGGITITGGSLPIGAGTGSTVNVTIQGGVYWSSARTAIPGNQFPVNNWNSFNDSSISFAASSTYYIYFDIAGNQFRAFLNPTGRYSLIGNGKLLYVLTTNSTNISNVYDFRDMDVFVNPKTGLQSILWQTGARAYNFTDNFLSSVNQKPVAAEAVGPYLPRYTRWTATLLCLVADAGYGVGDECSFVTGDTMIGLGLVWGGPMIRVSGGNVYVLQATETRILNATTFAWVSPTAGSWAVAIKMSYEYH